MRRKPVVLLLAGTAEAREIAEALAEQNRYRVIASLAGATETPVELPAYMRRGGFGGVEGMIEALRWDHVSAIIDATHPFADRISANAEAAARALGLPRVAVRRPEWRPRAGDDWRNASTLDQAAKALPLNTRAFLTTGRQSLSAFAIRRDVWFLARVVDPPVEKFPLPRGDFLAGRPPFSLGHERTVMSDFRIRVLVAKNSGGPAIAKLTAARELGLPVYMVERPPPPPGLIVETAADAVSWLGQAV